MNERKVFVAGWFLVDPEKRDEVVESYNDLVLRARSAPGCLDIAISADPVDPSRINNFEFWQSEKDLDSWRAAANPPKKITPILGGEMEKHVIHSSGPPF
jgi:quinol monooxygenase YgiN